FALIPVTRSSAETYWKNPALTGRSVEAEQSFVLRNKPLIYKDLFERRRGVFWTLRLRPVFNNLRGRLLHHDRAHHARMDGAHVVIGAGLVELVGKAFLGVERRGAEQPRITEHRVRFLVEIGPSHSRARLHC